jgi:toxin YoeB
MFSSAGWEHYQYWQANDPALATKINTVIRDCCRSPFSGLGKPEPLQGNYKGFWSRRLSREHRFIYRVTGSGDTQTLEIAACRYHYA